MDDERHVMMIGLPAAGKTTFLAALWYVVNNTDECSGALKLVKLDGDQEHLNRIRDQWLEYYEVDRTNPSVQETVSMELIDECSNLKTVIYFPDISGEEFREQFEERHCNKEYFNWLNNSCGALFFVNCGAIKRSSKIDEVQKLAEALGGESEEKNGNKTDEKIVLWEEKYASMSAKLVDLFQIVSKAEKLKTPYPVAIILSAWDLVRGRNSSPEKFLRESFPLLDQYLKSNEDKFKINCFGISAQGGRLDSDKPELREELAAKTTDPSSRIFVKTDRIESTDITTPIKWFMDIEYE